MRVQAVDVLDGARTWTVLGDDHCCVEPIEEFLEYHRVLGSSPNTVRSYAKGLQLWWAFVAENGVSWEDPGVESLRAFLTWLAFTKSDAWFPPLSAPSTAAAADSA